MDIFIRGFNAEIHTVAHGCVQVLSLRCGDHGSPSCFVQWGVDAKAEFVAEQLRALANMVEQIAPGHMRNAEPRFESFADEANRAKGSL